MDISEREGERKTGGGGGGEDGGCQKMAKRSIQTQKDVGIFETITKCIGPS